MPEVVEIGQVAETWVYPVKSMRGVQMDKIAVRSVSVVGDRRRGYQRSGSRQEFGWLSAKDYPSLILYSPYFTDPGKVATSEIMVKTPEGKDLPADSDQLLAELSERFGERVSLAKMGRGAYDSMPVSVASLGTIRRLGQQIGFEVDPRRFRENVLIETVSGIPNDEQGWIGKFLIFGQAEDAAAILAVKPDARCRMVNLDPDTGKSFPKVLRYINSSFYNNLGIYCSPAVAQEGLIRVGDRVYITNSLLS